MPGETPSMSGVTTAVGATLLALLVIGCGSAVTSPGPPGAAPSRSGDVALERTQRNEVGEVTAEVIAVTGPRR